ncbi:MAG TPA: MFS transporter [Myxococcaceae bacterium]|nr:MFS transporter [Myxococcaceae bacterium]
MALLSKMGLGDLEARPPRERATFFFLVGMSMFLFMDQNLTAPNLDAIAEDLVTTHAEVVAQLAKTDPEYQRLTAEWEKQQAVVGDLTKEIDGIVAELKAKDPAAANDPNQLGKAALDVARGRIDASRIPALTEAARIKTERESRVQTAFDREKDDKLAGRAALWFWLLGGVTALGIGYLTDKLPRKLLLFGTIVLGAAPCIATALVQNGHAGQFVLLRALTGFGIGAVIPLTYSLVGDLFSAKQRVTAVAYMGLAMGLGIAIGQLFAGFAGPTMGWRMPFVAVAVPNLVLATLFVLITREPARGSGEAELHAAMEAGGHYDEKIKLSDLKAIFSKPTNLLVFAQGIPGSMPWGFFFTYLVDYYHTDPAKKYSVEAATGLISIFAVGAILGAFLGGLLGARLYQKRTKYLPLLCGACILGGIAPLMVVVNWSSAQDPLAAALAGLTAIRIPGASIAGPAVLGFFGGMVATVPASNVKAVLINVNPPENRGTIFSLFNLADDLGKGVAPWLIGSVLAIHFGRTVSYNIAMLMWLVCGAAWAGLVVVFPKDVEKLEATMRARASNMAAGRAPGAGAAAA